MEIKTRFAINDIVFVIHHTNPKEVCPDCKGKERIKVNAINYYCGKCHGEGKVLSKKVKWWVSEDIDIITRIHTHTDEGGTDVIYFNDNRTFSDYLGEEKNLFSTQAEAQAECDRRNNK